MENKFPEGSTVYALNNPGVALQIRRYVDRVYFCITVLHPENKEQVYFEREITDQADHSNC